MILKDLTMKGIVEQFWQTYDVQRRKPDKHSIKSREFSEFFPQFCC